MTSPVEITLRNMRFHVPVGILPHEAEYPQPLEIDLTVWAEGATDGSIHVDYRDLHGIVTAVIESGPHLFLETIAQRIASDAASHVRVTGARVAVRKPHVLLPGMLDHAEVVVETGVRR